MTKKKAPEPPSSVSSFLHSTPRSSSVGDDDMEYFVYPSSDKYSCRPKTGTHKKQRAPPPPRQIKLQPVLPQQHQLPTATTLQKQDQQPSPLRQIDPAKNSSSANINKSFQSKFQFNSPPRNISPTPARRVAPLAASQAPAPCTHPTPARRTAPPTVSQAPAPCPPPAPAPPSSCPPPPPPPSTTLANSIAVKSANSKTKKSEKPENKTATPSMNPRDELMMAIRNSGGVNGLKPVNRKRW